MSSTTGDLSEVTVDRDHAVQIVKIDTETGAFSLNEDGLKAILFDRKIRDLPIVIVSVAGPFRKGKSFLLNFFLRYLRSEDENDWLGKDTQALEGFKWRPGAERDTVGVWMWNQVFVRNHNGKKVAVAIVDTQGTFDNKSTMRENAGIFAFNALISSFHVYNISGLIAEDVLQHMHLFTQYGTMVKESDQSSEKPFQTLMFLVRDWANPTEYPFGEQGGNKYLNKVLEVESSPKSEELRHVREQIRLCFEDLRCFLMPHPGFAVSENNDFDGQIKDIRPDFVNQLRMLVPLVLSPEHLVTKQLSSVDVSCKEMFDYMRMYVNLFENGELPEVGTVFEATAKVNHLNIKKKSLDKYRKELAQKVGPGRPYMQEEELVEYHERIKQEAMEDFHNTRKLGAGQYEEEFQEILLSEIQREFAEYQEANRHKQILSSMRTPIVMGGLAFVGNIIGTTFSLFGLETIGVLMSYVTWVCLLAVAFWLYSSYSGQMHTAAGEIDNFAKSVENITRNTVMSYMAGAFDEPVIKKKKDN